MDPARLLATYLDLEPEEATTLGVDVGADRLRDNTEAGFERRAALFREALAAPDADGGLDRAAFDRLARFELHLHESPWRWANPEWALYPYTMLRYQQASGAGPIAPRAAKVAAFLADDAIRLREGLARGHVAHRSLLAFLRDVLLPAAARFFDPIAPEAGAAYRAHAALYGELLARAPDDGTLGPDEYDRRWTLSFAGEPPADLAAHARDDLRALREPLVAAAQAVDPQVRGFDDACALVRALQAERLPEGTDVRAFYRGTLERVCAFVAERRLFDAEGALADLGMDEYPEGLRELGAGTNWPAPLLRPGGRGQFLLHPDPAAHPAAWSTVLAIHEGIPGHFLQSWHWQRRFGGHPAPLRFLCVADDVALPRQYFGAMLAIEGWAVHAEEVVRSAGFHTGRDALFALVAHAIRAARAVADVGLHRRELTRDEAAAFLAEHAGLPDAAARNEIERYLRGPLQAVTYYAGARAIRRLADAAGDDLAAFHDRLLALGPVPPGDLAAV